VPRSAIERERKNYFFVTEIFLKFGQFEIPKKQESEK
jgi:hypothetical protein